MAPSTVIYTTTQSFLGNSLLGDKLRLTTTTWRGFFLKEKSAIPHRIAHSYQMQNERLSSMFGVDMDL